MKRLYKSRKDKMIAGVCGGIAEYFDIDPVIVRLLFVIFFFIGGAAILAYIVGMIIMPQAPMGADESYESDESTVSAKSAPTPPATTAADTNTTYENKPVPASKSSTSLVIGILLVVVGVFFLMGNIPFLRHYYWWFRWHLKDFIFPGIFIVIGLILLIGGSRRNGRKNEDE